MIKSVTITISNGVPGEVAIGRYRLEDGLVTLINDDDRPMVNPATGRTLSSRATVMAADAVARKLLRDSLGSQFNRRLSYPAQGLA